MGLAPREESIEFAVQQLANAVWEKLQPRIREEIWQAKVQHAGAGPGASGGLHSWNPNPSSAAEPEHEEVESEQDNPPPWHEKDPDEEAEEGQQEGTESAHADAVMLPASIQIHHSIQVIFSAEPSDLTISIETLEAGDHERLQYS